MVIDAVALHSDPPVITSTSCLMYGVCGCGAAYQ